MVILVVMAAVYKGNSPHGIIWMQPHWWGILGLIGWAYFACATITLFADKKLLVLIGFFIFFLLFNSVVIHNPAVLSDSWKNTIGSLGLGNASNSSITIVGVICAVLYRRFLEKTRKIELILILIALILFVFGFATRPLWGISKIRATPSWTTICSAISILTFAFLIWLVDRKGKEKWFKIIKPAGTSTLTCYLLPYLHEAIFLSIIGIQLPLIIRTGWAGVVKSLVFALVIVLITGWLERRRLRLKI
jgi:predicted acyltransferase